MRPMEHGLTGMGANTVQAERAPRWPAEALSILYMAAIGAAAAARPQWAMLMFPELGALTHDVLTRPWGKWARQPVRLVVTPVATAVVGTMATRWFPYHVLTILLVVCISLGIIRALHSEIAPAISAGVLPLVLGVKSWLYPPGIAAGVLGLVAIHFALRGRSARPVPSHGPEDDVDDVLESEPGGRMWLAALLVFVAVAGLAAQTYERFILFPPLIVVAYEMFGHPDTCPWAARPLTLPLACGLTALGGLCFLKLFGPTAAAAGLAMGLGVLVLRAFDIHMPPVLAVGLIPMVMSHPTWKYPVSVTIGTLGLTIASLTFNRLMRQMPQRGGRR